MSKWIKAADIDREYIDVECEEIKKLLGGMKELVSLSERCLTKLYFSDIIDNMETIRNLARIIEDKARKMQMEIHQP